MMDENSKANNPLDIRSLAFDQLEAWSKSGAALKDELNNIIKDILQSLHKCKSPSKTLSSAMKKLTTFFSRHEVRGEFRILNNRHINFRLAFPENTNNGLIFSLLYGEINSRTGAAKIDLTSPIRISLHALQRLIERLGLESGTKILDEIYSCIGQVIHWHHAATEIDAKCWPITSTNGFFICTKTDDSLTTTAVTWVKSSGMSMKWGLALDNLKKLKERHPHRLEDSEFAREFIRSFPWMLHEHAPAEDIFRGKSDKNHEEQYFEYEKAEQGSHNLPKFSFLYTAGLNYKATPPPFKPNTTFSGIVVQSQIGGRMVVGLNNGWIGIVPWQSIKNASNLIPGYTQKVTGDEITVFVNKIKYFPDKNAYFVSLDPQELHEARWQEVKNSHPIGRIVNVSDLVRCHDDYFRGRTETGIIGLIPTQEVKTYTSHYGFLGGNPIGPPLTAKVKNYDADKKFLLLSVTGISESNISEKNISHQTGDTVIGRCIKKLLNYAVIETNSGVRGLLHNLNNWGEDLPEVGVELPLVVIKFDKSTLNLLLAGKNDKLIDRVFHAMPESEELWVDFIENHSIGDSTEVQVLKWREGEQCFLVSTKTGVVGSIHRSEIDFLCRNKDEQKLLLWPGEIINVIVKKINLEKKRVFFSKKAHEAHLCDEKLTNIEINTLIVGKVSRVVDYGYFVQIGIYSMDGLLHHTKVFDGVTLAAGDFVTVYVDKIDKENRRVSLSMAPCTS